MPEFHTEAEFVVFTGAAATTATTYRLTSVDGQSSLLITGTGFTYSDGVPTGGTITSVAHVITATDAPIFTIANINVSMADLGALMNDIFAVRSQIAWLADVDPDGDIILSTDTQIRLPNLDGTFTDIVGTGFPVPAQGQPVGTVTAIRHIAADGTTVLETVDIDETLAVVASAIFEDLASDTLFLLLNEGSNTVTGGGPITIGDTTFHGPMYDGDGDDTINGGGPTGVTYVEFEHHQVGGNIDLAAGVATFGAESNILNGIAGAGGTEFADTMVGSTGANSFSGWGGDDVLQGGSGNDELHGGEANDLLDGGDGVDVARYDYGSDELEFGVTVSLAIAGAQDTVGAGVDTLSSIENLIGSVLNDALTGNGGANSLFGNDGNDTLNGALGVDTIEGGSGDDTIIYAMGDGNGSMSGGDGSDTLSVTDGAAGSILNATWNGSALTTLSGNSLTSIETITAVLGAGVDWLIYAAGSAAVTVNLATGAASGFTSIANIERVVGGNGNDTLTGDGLDNRLDGAAGDDTLAGGGGIDTLIGGDGADVLSGGLSNDSIQAGAGGDTISWTVGEGRDTIDGGADSDTFNATGSGSADLGNVTWNGSSLTAVMDNGLSNIEAINLNLSGGVDWLIYNATAAVVVNLATNSASGFASVSNIEKVIGGSGNDTLTGDTLDNRLDGLAGADTLDGGAGADAVLGGDGADTIQASAGNDSLQGQNGNDTFHWTSVDGRDTFNGGADIDTVNLTGAAVADVADTNWNGSAITGLLNNALVDIELVNLDLGAGGPGGDWLRYNTASAISVDLGLGTATGFASITGVENLIGGTGGDSLSGDGGVNKINGNNGDDIITGGGGNDNLTGGVGSDTFVYAAGAGNDTINDFDAWVVGGQDFIDVSAFGINAGNFAARVAIIDTGADTVVRIDNTYFITLKNVSGDGDNSISDADFIFGP
jgi:Ca2+-binding RTX toxin-like protein